MKQLLLLVLTLSFFHHSFCQDYLPFPDSGAIWVNAHYHVEEYPDGGGPYFEFDGTKGFCNFGEDTLIEGITYSIIRHCNGLYKGALRQDGGKVFYVPGDSLNAYLLYDFSAEPGDLIEDVYIEDYGGYSPELYDIEVMDVDTVIVGGIERRRIHLGGRYWIEGIGNAQGLFLEYWENISGYLIELHCMSHNGVTYFQDNELVNLSGTCQWDLGINNLVIQKERLLAYPNPSQSTFTVDLPNGVELTKDVIVTNILGEMIVPTLIYVDNSIQIDLEGYTEGLYILNVIIDDIHYRSVMIKRG